MNNYLILLTCYIKAYETETRYISVYASDETSADAMGDNAATAMSLNDDNQQQWTALVAGKL